jgi:hypothetical protein
MNPYWINPAPDTDEWLHSDKVKQNFFLLVAGHAVLWIVSLCGIVFLYTNAQKTAPIEAFTSSGEPAFGIPVPTGTPQAAEKQEEFLESHLKNIFSYLFTRTEKGTIPELQNYVDGTLLAILNYKFNFVKKPKGTFSQTFYIQEFENIQGSANSGRRVYRIHGLISSHDLEGSSNTPVYLIAAVDRLAPTQVNPLGWYVTAVINVDPGEYYNKERQALIDEVTKPQPDVAANKAKAGAGNGTKAEKK